MITENTAPLYFIWGVDQTAYGPIELPALVSWIKEERVLTDTWIFMDDAATWVKASEIPELKMFFTPKLKNVQDPEDIPVEGELTPGALRRIKILAEMDDEQLRTFLKYIETIRLRPFTHFIKRGASGDALYAVLEGELRTCLLIEGRECPLATLSPGNVFGEISLLDRGAHTMDVFSNQESLLIKFTGDAFARMAREEPRTALGFLHGLTKGVAGRVRTLTKRFEESQFAQFAQTEQAA